MRLQDVRTRLAELAENGVHIFSVKDFVTASGTPPSLHPFGREGDTVTFESEDEMLVAYRRDLSAIIRRKPSERLGTHKYDPVRVAQGVYSYRGYTENPDKLSEYERFRRLTEVAACMSEGAFSYIALESAMYYNGILPYSKEPFDTLHVMRDIKAWRVSTVWGNISFSYIRRDVDAKLKSMLLDYPELMLPVSNFELTSAQLNRRHVGRKTKSTENSAV